MSNKSTVNHYLYDYLQKMVPNFVKKGKTFVCPICGEKSCNEFPPDSGKLFCFGDCKSIGDIVELCRKLEFEDNPDVPRTDIKEYLIEMFDIKTDKHIEQLFNKYEQWQWDMVPVNKGGKESWIEKDWQLKHHKQRNEWEQWLEKINMGVQTGKKSNIVCMDFDFIDSKLKKRIYEGNPTDKMLADAKKQWEAGLKMVKEKLPFIDWTTVQQKTFGGVHIFYKYDDEILKTAFNYEGIHIDIQSDGGQVVIEPSIVGEQKREIIGDEIKDLPKELKEFIINHTENKKEEKIDKKVIEDTELSFENLNNNRNNTFVKLYGELRKEMPIKVAYNTLYKFNKLLDKQLPIKELKAMAREAEKYHKADVQTISENIINHFKLVQQDVHIRDLKDVLRIERSDIEQALRYLQDEDKIKKIKRDLYRLNADVEWRTDFIEMSKPLQLKVPYFNDYAYFNQGSMIVIGGKTGTGKSHITMNIIEKFVKQGVQPKLITTEADSGAGEVALSRGMKEGDFKYYRTSDPTSVPFYPGEVRIIDWLKAPNSEFFKLDTIYEALNNKLVDNGGLLIVFAQLKKENGQFYAENMVEQFASFVCKFLYSETNGVVDNLHPYFKTTKIRRPKGRMYQKIPLEFIPETKEVKLR